MDWERVAAHEPAGISGAEREAAVLAPVVTREDGDYLLFTKRADHLGEHPGQMSFPGGGRETEDADLEATAKREAHEEIGLEPQEVAVRGRLDDIPTVSNYAVRPFVASIPDREYTPDEREVAEIAVLSLSDLTDLENYESERRDHPYYGDIRIHYFHVDGYTVWGATGRMLVQFLELATDWEEPEEVDRVVDPDADYPV
ncbi:CoA pyrophosphatase [Natronomonas salina]|uniref:NUDIX hydrolase n=1 Tax=Natronomonas salina TaxID=1710540 RepID=UPI0015B5CDB2|nr:CoA pyrophosphatase [Natronomonas salina]QLD91261.1 CoA pyrophosphatase [Natronomonas salina]